MNISLNGRRALVTGGNSGIGAAIVLALAQAGADVAINYLADPEAARSLAGRVGERGVRALALQSDVSDPEAVARMFARIDEAWGGLDVLVNNAGIDGRHALACDADPAEWRRVVEVNLFGAFHCAREALKRMVPRKAGVILNVSSVHELIAWSGYSAYTASKAAVGMMTKTLAQEAAPSGVRVLAVGPGAIKTPINESVWSDPTKMKDLLEKVPLKRIGTPDEIARIAVVLVSDVSSYITGRTIFVDGGMSDFPDFGHGG
jgi:glucose 1-dehydrogenase